MEVEEAKDVEEEGSRERHRERKALRAARYVEARYAPPPPKKAATEIPVLHMDAVSRVLAIAAKTNP